VTARALVVQHTATEGPGRLAEWLPAAGVELDVVRPYAGEPLPASLDADGGLVVMGGPMGANDDDAAPWLPHTRELLREAVAAGVPVLGICLGAQLLAAACGGQVERGAAGPELGVGEVRLRPAATADPLLAGLPPVLRAVQWHYDAVTELPADAVWLAESAAYRHQAFRVGERAWGVQFHVETSTAMVAGWARNDAAELSAARLDPAELLGGLAEAQAELSATWGRVVGRWAALMPAAASRR
jgi:GMP synthase (glutamine-hydrolysing)